MKKLGKEPLVSEVAAAQDKAALVFLGYASYWIILPDKRMILWRHYAPASFLKWTASISRLKDARTTTKTMAGALDPLFQLMVRFKGRDAIRA
jgi:hypothetical protein